MARSGLPLHLLAMADSELTRRMMAAHDTYAQRFFAHQQALLDRDFARASRELGAYREILLAHMRDEEAYVLKRYEALGGDATDAPLRLFLGEHKNLRTFVDEFVDRVESLAAKGSDHALLELFDREATYKNLMLHHDLRERNMLYPFLAARLSAKEQEQLLAACASAGD